MDTNIPGLIPHYHEEVVDDAEEEEVVVVVDYSNHGYGV